MAFWHGKIGGWMLIVESTDEGVKDKSFCHFLVVTFIWNYPQAEDMNVYNPPVGSLEEN